MRFYKRLILASVSPRRAELIRKIGGFDIEIVPSRADEAVFADETPQSYAVRVAAEKAQEVFDRIKPSAGTVVLGCDTVVSLNGEIFGKPADKAEAGQMFRLLCGEVHEVITGICVIGGGKKIRDYEKTLVTFGAFDEKTIGDYIGSGAPFDKAGGYGLQDKALSPLITKVEGDPDNVIGLPVGLVKRILKENF